MAINSKYPNRKIASLSENINYCKRRIRILKKRIAVLEKEKKQELARFK